MLTRSGNERISSSSDLVFLLSRTKFMNRSRSSEFNLGASFTRAEIVAGNERVDLKDFSNQFAKSSGVKSSGMSFKTDTAIERLLVNA